MKRVEIILALLLFGLIGYAQQFNEKITKEFAFEKKSDKNALMIANINGNVTVEGYNGDKIMVEVDKEILAKTNERLEQGNSLRQRHL